MDFNYFLPVNLVFGRGKFNLLGEITKGYGSKALIVTYANSADSPLIERATEILKSAGVDVVIFDQVFQNPLTTTAIAGAKMACDNSCDVVIGIGGGSIMDCAKAIAFLAENDGDINDYIFNIKVSEKALPVILVPTTCGTGSEGNGFAVLTNPENGDKKSLRCNAIVAKASIIDSTLMETMPKHILAAVGFDALCHNIEAYMANNAQPMTDMMTMYAMKIIAESLVPLYQGATSPDLWDKLTLGSTLGGMVINTAGVTVAHGMEHPASGLRDLVHGLGLASLTPVVMEKTVAYAPEKCAVISKLIGGDGAHDCVDKINEILEKLNLKIGLKEQGISEDDIPWMVENFFKVSIGGLKNHPVEFSKEEIAEIFRLAL